MTTPDRPDTDLPSTALSRAADAIEHARAVLAFATRSSHLHRAERLLEQAVRVFEEAERATQPELVIDAARQARELAWQARVTAKGSVEH